MSSGRAVVLGLGAFGGGAGAAKHLAKQGFDVLVTDRRSADELETSLADLQPWIDNGSIAARLGGHNVSDFTAAELVVVNPGVPKPWENRFVRAAYAAGARVTTEIALAIDALPAETLLVGVTGSVGKSTTSAMIHAGLAAAGLDARLGGNIGGSLLDADGSPGIAVIELSSAMLWWLRQPGALRTGRWLGVGVVTNLAPNHLDWHGTAEHYAASKRAMIDAMRPGSTAVLGPGLRDWTSPEGVERIEPASAFAQALLCPGAHNAANASLALGACVAAGADAERAAAGIASFPGLPHRLEHIRSRAGVAWINDSKSTMPEATRTAVDAFAGRRVHLIVGGSDKGADLSPLAELVGRVASLLCIGVTGDRIAAMAGRPAVGTLERAVAAADESSSRGEVVLLSPGCASFDRFRSYEHRGETFRSLVHSLS